LGIGSGFTGRLAMGQRPVPWSYVRGYASNLARLLAGETIEIDGAPARMLHGPGQAPARPLRVPLLFGTGGPKGEAVARELGEGVLTVGPTPGFAWSAMLACGTVLEPGEPMDSPRVLLAAGAGAAVAFHRAWDAPGRVRGIPLEDLPGGAAWREAIGALPAAERHLHTHYGHLTFPNDIDRRVLGADAIRRFTLTGEPAAVRERVARLGERGVTELVYQPAGPDIEGELARFARAVGLER
jgi:5,10-methylenetetrahydromethanopterin reductase